MLVYSEVLWRSCRMIRLPFWVSAGHQKPHDLTLRDFLVPLQEIGAHFSFYLYLSTLLHLIAFIS